jgi:hypothetical protein
MDQPSRNALFPRSLATLDSSTQYTAAPENVRRLRAEQLISEELAQVQCQHLLSPVVHQEEAVDNFCSVLTFARKPTVFLGLRSYI